MKLFVTLIILGCAFLLAYFGRFQNLQLPGHYQLALLYSLLLCALIFPATGTYRPEFKWSLFRRLRRILAGWSAVLMLLIATAAALKLTEDYSRIWFGYWALFSALSLVLVEVARQTYQRHAARRSGYRKKIVLVGAGDVAERVENRIRNESSSDLEIAACFGPAWSAQATRPLHELAAYIAGHEISEVWICVPWEEKQLLDQVLEALSTTTVDINVIPDLFQYRLLNQGIIERNGLPMINLCGSPLSGSELLLKSVVDWILALVLFVLLLPLLIVISLLVLISSRGPVLFRQPRHGIGGEPIGILKFRTMVVHNEPEHQLTQAQPADDRVTAIGKWLRRTSLDELPQLLNVLKGEMSLVGPRPHAIQHNEFYKSRIPRYMLRHKVKPGITGWSQVNGLRGLTDTEDKMLARVEHDLWYIQNWSLWLDIKILLLTPLILLTGKNAY